jgi:hypothetical protein
MYKHFFYLVVVLSLVPPTLACAFDNKQTHPLLTEIALTNTEHFDSILKVQLGIDEGVKGMLNNGEDTYSITKWLREGSKEEDDPACRASSHFHNPLKSWNESKLTDPIWLVDLWCDASSPFLEKYSNVSWATGFSDKDGNTMSDTVNGVSASPEQNGRNWFVARDRYYSALTEDNSQQREAFFAETFRTLGYVLHLLEDMAVPAHTRNDFSEGHSQVIGCPDEGGCFPISWIGNPFEGYVRDNFDIIEAGISTISKPFTGEKKLTSFWDTDTHVPGTMPTNFTDSGLGLAEYTNANFVSYATILKKASDTEHYFPYPNRDSIADQDYPDQISLRKYNILARDNKLDEGVYITKNLHGEQIDKFLKPRYMLYGADWDSEERYDLKFTLDEQCYLEYATRLIPRAIGYSATLLDYFFRGKLEVKLTNGQVKIVNRSGETMEDGRFELYYEVQDGTRKAISGLTDAKVIQPLLPDGSQTISFTEPSDFYTCTAETKLVVVYRGKLGHEQDAIAGKIVSLKPGCVVLKVGENTGTQLFTVWDPGTNAVANISDPETADPISFPAEYAEISNWLSERSTTVTTPAYEWEMENNALKRIGESWQDIEPCSCTVDTDSETSCNDFQEAEIFTHPRCGDFQSYCDYSQSLLTLDGNDVWNTVSEGTVYVDKDYWESILGSYAPVVNTASGTGEAACMRSEWYQRQSIRSYVPDGSFVPFNEWEITQPIKWITPIGEMDLPSQSYEGADDYYSTYYCPSTYSWSRWHRNPPYDGDPVAKPIIYANYSEKVMVQLYLVSTVQWSGTGEEEEFIVNGNRECQVTSYEESYETNNSLVAASTLYGDGAMAHDPRSQARNPDFEKAVLSLVEDTVTAQQVSGEISEEDIFLGGLSIYIAGQDNIGPEAGLLQLVNEGRAFNGLYPLLPDNNLNNAAQRHATDMAVKKSLFHTGSDGSTIQDRFNETGYGNIVKPGGASGGTEYVSNGYETADALFIAFRDSLIWDEIMNSGYREMGAASKVDSEGKRYWCLTFGFNDEH